MRFAMLGPLEVRGDDGRPVEIGGARLRALLARLALDAGRMVTVASLIDGLWGESPPASAVNAVQSLASRLRRTLATGASGGPAGPDEAPVEGLPGGYRLAVDRADVDVNRFTELADAGRRALDSDPAAAAELLREALALWRGPALADMAEAPFAAAVAARLEDRRLAATEDRIAADLALGRHAELLTELDGLAAAHPLRERLQGQRITALYGAGRQADALAAYDQTRRTLAEELGVDPSAELTDLHRAVLQHDPALRPAAGPAPRTNLRAPLTSFVGREEEVERVGKLLDEARLVTLVGPGGAGKTRLATEAAAGLTTRYPDGVWLVELAPIRDPADVPQAIVTALDLREVGLLERGPGPRPDLVERLVAALAGRRPLIVLDNCEHLVTAAARISDELLTACPSLRILATSREPLGITGETVCPVPPLGLPELPGTPEDALTYPAVRLFADRAAAVQLGFGVDAGNVGTVVEICRRLDGMPLAIELAAARLRSLSPDQIADRLGDRFRLLTGGSRTALPRHQTLRAVVAWSWDLLSEPERVVARRLSAFPGGATLESAEEVCGRDGIPPDTVLDLLTGLVDKSFATAVHGDGRAVRYRMLETVRAFSSERLADSGEEDTVRDRHAHYFLALAETAEPLLRSAQQLVWADRLAAEHDNLRAALRWAIDAGDAEVAARLVAAMGWFWVLRGSHAEASSWLAEALAVPGDLPAETRAVAHAYRAAHGVASGDTTTAKEALEIARAAATGLDRPGAHPAVWMLEVADAIVRDDRAAAQERIDRIIAEADSWTATLAVLGRGHLADNFGDAAAAERDFTAALDAFSELNERWGLSGALSSLANVYELRGDVAAASRAIDRALNLMSALGASQDWAQLRVRQAASLGRQGDVAGGLAILDAAVADRGAESPESRMMFAIAHGELYRRAGDLPTARRHLDSALSEIRPGLASPHHMRALALVGLVYVELADGNPAAAVATAGEAVVTAKAARDMPIAAAAVDSLAAAVLGGGDPALAAALFGAAARLRGAADLGNPDVRAATAAAREALGADSYQREYRRVAGLSHDQVFALIDELEPQVARSEPAG